MVLVACVVRLGTVCSPNRIRMNDIRQIVVPNVSLLWQNC